MHIIASECGTRYTENIENNVISKPYTPPTSTEINQTEMFEEFLKNIRTRIMKIDLHIHTTYSDGAFSPEQIVDTAIAQEMNVIALTDHDNILSCAIAQEYAKSINADLEIIQGVEINTLYKAIVAFYSM